MMRKACSYAPLARVALPVRVASVGVRFSSVLANGSRARAPMLRQKCVIPKVSVYTTPCRFASSYPSHTKIGMPALSPTMTQGNIAKWNKKVGDQVKAGDAIAEIETDKSTMAFESTEDGYLAQILVPDGAKDIPINKLIAILVDSKDDVAKFADFKGEEPKAAPSQPPSPPKAQPQQQQQQQKPQQPQQPAKPSKSYPPHITIGMPALSPTMAKGNIAGWRKKEGDQVKSGDIIADIETDKSTMEFECTEEGYVAKILFPGKATEVDINTPIAILAENKDDIAKFKDYTPPQKQQKPQETQEQPQQQAQPQQRQAPQAQQPSGGRVAASPLAKSLGAQHSVDISQIRGTGPNNRVIRDDVLEFVAAQKARPAEAAAAPEAAKAPKAAPTPSGTYTDIPVSNIRKVTAERLLMSKQTIPHYYLTMDVRVDKLLKLRTELNEQSNGKYKLSVNDFIIKASALAMHRVPTVNSSWNDQFIRRYNNVDINVAVNTDQGLFTPIVANADKRGLSDIASAVKTLAEKAKAGKLAPAEFQGGTFTISNLGMFGIKHFAAVINPPQAAILAVGGASQRLVPAETKGDAQYETATVLTVTLSCDHRVVDGAVGAEWLQAFKDFMENPMKLLL